MTQFVTPFDYEQAIIRQHSENRLIENTLDHAIISNRRQKSAFTPFQASSKMIVSNNKGVYRYSPSGYERTSDNSQVLNLRKQRDNRYPMVRYVNGENINDNGKYALPPNTQRSLPRENIDNGMYNNNDVNRNQRPMVEGMNEYNEQYDIVSGNNQINYEPNMRYVNNNENYNNNYYSNNNNNFNRNFRYSPNNVQINNYNESVNPNFNNRSFSTNDINAYNYPSDYPSNINNGSYPVSQSQNLSDYRCRDNNSAHNNIMTLRRPPQYYKDSILYHKYNSNRNDYANSRFGDQTYNYYLNSPMRGDRSKDWRYPPQYYYMPKFNSKTYTYENY